MALIHGELENAGPTRTKTRGVAAWLANGKEPVELMMAVG